MHRRRSQHSLISSSVTTAAPRRRVAGPLCVLAVAMGLLVLAASVPQALSQQQPNANGSPEKDQPTTPRPIPPEDRFVLEPYRMRISLAFAPSAQLMPAFRSSVRRSLRECIGRGYGTMWAADIRENTWLAPPTALGVQRLSKEQMLKQAPTSKQAGMPKWDKVFLLVVEADGPRYRITGRAFDTRAQSLGPVQSMTTYERRRVAETCFTLLTKLFQPVLEVQAVNGYTVELRVRAAAFAPADPALAQIRPDDVILPYFRYYDKEDVIRRIQQLPWTYVLTDEVDHEYITGSLVSTFRAPLGRGRTRRVDLLARRVRPHRRHSRLKMVYQTDETKPLVGYDIRLVKKRFPRDEAAEKPLKQFSGRDGYARVPVDPEHPVLWVYVYSGKALLARVPYVPGIAEEETIPLPDDSIRLSVEGRLELLKSRLIDTVARRATLMALAIKLYNDEDLTVEEKRKQVLDKLAELRELEDDAGRDEFLRELSSICDPSLSAARRLGNSFAERRIKRMCDKTEELIKAYLVPGEVDRFQSDLDSGEYSN